MKNKILVHVLCVPDIIVKIYLTNQICVEYGKKLRKKFKPIDIIYKLIKKPEKKILCYSSNDMSKAYRKSCSQGEKTSHGFVFECYYCRKFFARVDKQKLHVENCSGIHRVVYNFDNQYLVTFEDNLKFKGNLPMAIYFDFEKTAPGDNCFDSE